MCWEKTLAPTFPCHITKIVVSIINSFLNCLRMFFLGKQPHGESPLSMSIMDILCYCDAMSIMDISGMMH